MSDALIIAPHIDDEMIGCYTVLAPNRQRQHTNVYVLYLEELTRTRKDEAWKAAEVAGFYPIFGFAGLEERLRGSLRWANFSAVYVPRRQDAHPAHKYANSMFRTRATHFYSVDMGAGARALEEELAREKQRWLYRFYPSQRSYFDQHAEAYLFEHISERDYTVYKAWTFHHTQVELDAPVLVMACEDYDASVQRWWRELDTVYPAEAFNALVSVCPFGDVQMLWEGRLFAI